MRILLVEDDPSVAASVIDGLVNASMEVDGREIYSAKDLRVGLFTSTDDF